MTDADDKSRQSAARGDSDEVEGQMKKLEEDPPKDLEDWPDGKAKYETLGGAEGNHSYDEGPERNMGPSGVRHHEDGSVEIDGEKVDDPEKFKGDPIPGGPTDPEAPDAVGKSRDEKKEELEGSESS